MKVKVSCETSLRTKLGEEGGNSSTTKRKPGTRELFSGGRKERKGQLSKGGGKTKERGKVTSLGGETPTRKWS